MPLFNCKTEISECVHYDTQFLSFCLKNVLMLICMKVLLAEKVGVFFVIPPSFGGFGGQRIGVDRTLIKSGTVSYTRGVCCLLEAACFTETSPSAAGSSSHVAEHLQRCTFSADTLLH